jgi:Deoxynucleoside kinases
MVITLAGMIGAGKSSLSKMTGDLLETPVKYEPVKDNPVLPLYYEDPKQYAFLLQIYFLNVRFDMIKDALRVNNSVLDRSIYEDALFTRQNHLSGNLRDAEMDTYEHLLRNMLEEIEGMPKKAPDLMVYLKSDFGTIIDHIQTRGRVYEQGEDKHEYYRSLLDRYDEFEVEYDASPMLVIDATDVDFVNNEDDAKTVLLQIIKAMHVVGALTDEQSKFYHDKVDPSRNMNDIVLNMRDNRKQQ